MPRCICMTRRPCVKEHSTGIHGMPLVLECIARDLATGAFIFIRYCCQKIENVESSAQLSD